MAYPKSIIALGLLLFLSGNPGFAQGYESIFGDSSTSWKVFNTPSFQTFIDSIFTKNDTIINNKKYRTIFFDRNFHYPLKIGAIREDTGKGKVWFRNFRSEAKNESLLYDLTLTKNDSFYLDSGFLNISASRRWITVDSVYKKNGRKQIVFEEFSDRKLKTFFRFIEGVGTSFGLGIKFNLAEQSSLICAYKDQKRKFINQGTILQGVDTIENSCFEKGKISSRYNDPTNNKIGMKVYPNPAKHQVTFQIFEAFKAQSHQIKIINARGKPILDRNFSSNKITLTTSAVKPGLYAYRLTNGKGQLVKTGKIVFVK